MRFRARCFSAALDRVVGAGAVHWPAWEAIRKGTP
jgi:hypothetical protein